VGRENTERGSKAEAEREIGQRRKRTKGRLQEGERRRKKKRVSVETDSNILFCCSIFGEIKWRVAERINAVSTGSGRK